MENRKCYYAILPANVRYDKELTANAKLLYAEITSLCNDKGFCWATNKYFSELYGVSERSITNWIYELYSRGYIDCSKQYDNKESEYYGYRKIFLGGVENFFYHNNINKNNKKKEDNNNKLLLSKKEKFLAPTLEEIKNYCINVRKNQVDYQYFYDYFTEGNWIDSEGKKVKNWKQKIITWEKNKNNNNFKINNELPNWNINEEEVHDEITAKEIENIIDEMSNRN